MRDDQRMHEKNIPGDRQTQRTPSVSHMGDGHCYVVTQEQMWMSIHGGTTRHGIISVSYIQLVSKVGLREELEQCMDHIDAWQTRVPEYGIQRCTNNHL